MSETKTDSPNKRVLNEIKKFNLICQYIDNKYVHIPLHLNESLQKQSINNKNKPTLILNVENYPFSVPIIYYLSKPVGSIYCTGSIFIDDYNKMTGNGCMCCESFACNHNWVPSSTMFDIVYEFYKITNIKCRLIERLYCDKVQSQLVKSINAGAENTLSVKSLRIAEYL